MSDATNPRAVEGGNHPPEPVDPIDDALAPYVDFIEEAGNWLDGEPVANAK